MKKIIAYLFIFIYLFSFQEVRQIMKFPNLIEHYISHELRDQKINISSFIKMHYIDEQIVDSDYHQDMKLPFKTHDISMVSYNLAMAPKILDFSFELKKLFLENHQNFTYKESFTSQNISSVFRPPILG